jgi:hypothetical protein
VVLYKTNWDEDLQCTAGKGFKIYGLIINYGLNMIILNKLATSNFYTETQ